MAITGTIYSSRFRSFCSRYKTGSRDNNNRAGLFSTIVLGLALALPSVVSAQDESQQNSAQQEEQQTEEQKFDLWEFRVVGNTLLEKRDIESTLYPYLGRGKDANTVEMAKKALQERYAQAGYHTVIVDTPPQDGEGGILRFKVIEGRVGRIRVVDSDYFLLSRIKNEVPALEEGKVPHMPTVQKQLAQLNGKTPDRRVSPYMKPGRKAGTVDFDLKVKDQFPLHGDIELNDQYSSGTEKLRLSGSLRYTNLWQKEHSASVQFMTTPEDVDQINILSATYMFKPDLSDNYHVFYAVNSKSDLATLGDSNTTFTVKGDGHILGYRRITPYMPVDGLSHSLTLGIDYKSFVDSTGVTIGVGGTSVEEVEETPIDYVMFSAGYSATQRRNSSSTTFNAGARFGVRELENDKEEFEGKSYSRRPNFLAFKGGITHKHDLFWGLQSSSAFNFQIANTPLISNERHSVGGANTVRGYLESQISGDDAVLYKLTLHKPLQKYIDWQALDEWRFGLFAEGGFTRKRGELEEDDITAEKREITVREEIHSAGINMQIALWERLFLTLDWGKPLTDNGDVERGDARTHFRLRYQF